MSNSPQRRWSDLPAIGAVLMLLALLVTGCATHTADPPAATTPVSTSTSTSTATATTAPAMPAALQPSRPDTLEIPAIGVHSGHIVDLGLTGSGELQVPGDAITTGWFTGSPSPGEAGPAVLAAHVDYNHVLGTFHRLKDLHPGDQALVHRADGATAVFAVYRVEAYPKTSFPTDDVYGDTGDPELRLITCGGTYDKATRNYEDNIVAYAKLVEVR